VLHKAFGCFPVAYAHRQKSAALRAWEQWRWKRKCASTPVSDGLSSISQCCSPDGLRRSAFNSTPSGLGGLGVISQIRWLTHTGREVSPSGLKPNSLTRGLAPHPPAPLSPSQSPGGEEGPSGFYKASWFRKNQRHCSPKAPCSTKDRNQSLSITGSDLVSWLFPLCPLRLCGETHRPCHQPGPLMKRTRGLSQVVSQWGSWCALHAIISWSLRKFDRTTEWGAISTWNVRYRCFCHRWWFWEWSNWLVGYSLNPPKRSPTASEWNWYWSPRGSSWWARPRARSA